MAKLVPQQTIDALRSFNDLAVDVYGIDCQLFIKNNPTYTESDDIYTRAKDSNFTVTKTQAFVVWNPDAKMLRKLGVFTEGELPIICWFKNDPKVVMGSYIKINMQYVPRNYDSDEFEIVDVVIRGIYDAIVLNAYKLAPRRVKTLTVAGEGK